MSSEVMLSSSGAMKQAEMTADDYLMWARSILEKSGVTWTISDAIELTKVMAQDYHTAMMCMKMQEIRNSINAFTESHESTCDDDDDDDDYCDCDCDDDDE